MFQYSVLLLVSVILFLYGFFPIPNYDSGIPNAPPTRIGNLSIELGPLYGSHFQKIILIVIDALRWDFATPELMPLTMGLMNSSGCLSKVSVESPTVTLPRIKALTTGSVSQYIDVVKNLASSEILEDSWLHSAKKKGLKIVFYGDNTWEKLFPQFFVRSEGTTSFFVWDFTEVDDNVTRNVHLELQRSDWDIMILHYLGLDHIGHVLGPFSSRMPLKLTEMDRVIHDIYQGTKYTDSLVLITGDHGMRDGGGHGGTSHTEVTVPLITIGHSCKNSSFLQTDIPANLAVLLGLHIPTTSIGKLQRAFLHNLNDFQYLYALGYNTGLLQKKDTSNLCRNTFDKALHYHEQYLRNSQGIYAELAKEMYLNCSEMIFKELYETSNRQDMPLLVFIVLMLFNVLVLCLLSLLHLKRSLACDFVLYGSVILMSVSPAIGMLVLVPLITANLKKLVEALSVGIIRNKFLIATCILHPITFVSTSFIEEEHYFWVFFTLTLSLLLFVEHRNVKLCLGLACIRFSMDLNATIENSVQKHDNWANILILEQNQSYHQAFFAFGLVLVLLTLYSELKNSHWLLGLNFLTLTSIFLLKSATYHNTFLGKLTWGLIVAQKITFQTFSWRHFWLMCATLLIKPHNVVLIPLAIFIGHQLLDPQKLRDPICLSIVSYMLSNCFYFLQGHRNSLASLDISIGYTGLNDYYPVLVIGQVLIHTYTFPVLFHLECLRRVSDQNAFWDTLLTLRTSVFLFTSIIMIAFRHHLFVWSVFAPKLFIESIHAGFLFVEICLNLVFRYLGCDKDLKYK